MTALPSPHAPKRPPLRYRGGKWRLAPWIISHFPPHETYVEPFMGGASVLFRKEPSELEIINDLDGEVVAFFRVLRDDPEALTRSIELTPHARDELAYCYAPSPGASDMEKARRMFVRSFLAFGASGKKSGFRLQKSLYGWGKNFPRQMKNLDHLPPAAVRLRNVQIENIDALELIRRVDGPDVLIYTDPPYVASGRAGRLYRHEMMSQAEHNELAHTLNKTRAMVVLSGTPSPEYDRLYRGWRRVDIEAMGERQNYYTEALWLNPAADKALRASQAQTQLFQEA